MERENVTEDRTHVSPTNGRYPQEQGASRTSEEIIVLVSPTQCGNLVQSFEDEITHAAGALPLYVFWPSVSGVLHQGVIVLASDGTIPVTFLQSLARDHDVVAFVVYDWTVREDSEEEQDQTSQKIAEP